MLLSVTEARSSRTEMAHWDWYHILARGVRGVFTVQLPSRPSSALQGYRQDARIIYPTHATHMRGLTTPQAMHRRAQREVRIITLCVSARTPRRHSDIVLRRHRRRLSHIAGYACLLTAPTNQTAMLPTNNGLWIRRDSLVIQPLQEHKLDVQKGYSTTMLTVAEQIPRFLSLWTIPHA